MISWHVGHAEKERLIVDLLSPAFNDCGYEWIGARATIDVGGFHGEANLSILRCEMVSFLRDLRILYENLSGRAEFNTIEDQLQITIESSHLGHLTVSGYLMDRPGSSNRLTFALEIDQSFLPSTIEELYRAIKEVTV